MSMRKATLSVYDSNLCYAPASCKRKPYRTTQIAAYIKPDSTEEKIIGMIEAGLNVAVFDYTKGKETAPDVEKLVTLFNESVKKYNSKRCEDLKTQLKQNKECDEKDFECVEVHVATALDIKGTYLESGKFENEAKFEVGKEIKLTSNPEFATKSNADCIYIAYDKLSEIAKGTTVILNGCGYTTVIESKEKELTLKVHQEGEMKVKNESIEINFQGQKIELGGVDDLPSVSTFCRKNNITMVFIPINDPNTMKSMKCVINPEGVEKVIKVIAKVEAFDAARNIDKIIEKADGVLIGRKRLGYNILPEQVPVYQKMIISKCLKAGVPSIIGNHLLSDFGFRLCGASRSQCADLFNAVLDGADCTMLDIKSSNVEAINSMKFTIMEAEDMTNYRRWNRDLITQVSVPCAPIHCGYFTDSLAIAATTCAMVNGASAIIAITNTGKTVKFLSKYRPECPIISVANNKAVAERVILHRGVFAICSSK